MGEVWSDSLPCGQRTGQSLVSLLTQPQGVTQMSPGVGWEKERWTAAPPTARIAFSSWSYISNPNLVKMQWGFPWAGTLGKQAGFILSKIRQSACPLHPPTSRILTMECTSSSALSARPGEAKPFLQSYLSWSCGHVVGSQPSLGLGRTNDFTGLYNDNLHSSFRGIISVHSHHSMAIGTLALFSRSGA